MEWIRVNKLRTNHSTMTTYSDIQFVVRFLAGFDWEATCRPRNAFAPPPLEREEIHINNIAALRIAF